MDIYSRRYTCTRLHTVLHPVPCDIMFHIILRLVIVFGNMIPDTHNGTHKFNIFRNDFFHRYFATFLTLNRSLLFYKNKPNVWIECCSCIYKMKIDVYPSSILRNHRHSSAVNLRMHIRIAAITAYLSIPFILWTTTFWMWFLDNKIQSKIIKCEAQTA